MSAKPSTDTAVSADEKFARELGQKRLAVALNKIERAQNLLSEAMGELCPIVGGVKLWNRGRKLHDQVKDYWYAVRALEGKNVRVDAACAAYERRRAAERISESIQAIENLP